MRRQPGILNVFLLALLVFVVGLAIMRAARSGHGRGFAPGIRFLVSGPSLDRLAARVQTTLPHELPMTPDPGGDDLGELKLRLNLAASRMNVTIITDESFAVLWGYAPGYLAGMAVEPPDGRKVYVAPWLSPNGHVHTLAHELAHLLQPHELEPSGPRGKLSGEREMFAEGVAYLLTGHLDVSGRYLARHKMSLPVLDRYRKEIRFAVQFLRGEV